MRVGDQILIQAHKADGFIYRWWHATVEAVQPDQIITWQAAGDLYRQPNGDWPSKYGARFYYWMDKRYNLVELFDPTGEFNALYVHIASRPWLTAEGLAYHDQELDVIFRATETAPVVLDEDEFAEAALQYGYTAEFQAECRQAVAEALELVRTWARPAKA